MVVYRDDNLYQEECDRKDEKKDETEKKDEIEKKMNEIIEQMYSQISEWGIPIFDSNDAGNRFESIIYNNLI